MNASFHIPARTAPSRAFAPHPAGMLQRKCVCGGGAGPTGACAECRRKRKLGAQPKLRINRPGDRYEQEADRIADKVMRMPEAGVSREAPLAIQRRVPVATAPPEKADSEAIQRLGPRIPSRPEEEEEDRVQAKAASGPAADVAPDAASSVEALRGGGRPLAESERAFFEPRFGHDFSNVRIHADGRAAESAQKVRARAYTVGRDIVFGAGQYTPGTKAGRWILAHELTHVVQQSGHGSASGTGGGIRLQRLGRTPDCTDAQRDAIHQAVFNARGWLNKAIPQLEATPLSGRVTSSLRRNFGPTYGAAANAELIRDRLRAGYREISTIPFRCRDAADATCAASHCGYAHAGAGGHEATICHVTLAPGIDWRIQAACVLHEGFHAAFSRFTFDHYSGWHGLVGRSPAYPGADTEPLLNADSYTTLAMDLS